MRTNRTRAYPSSITTSCRRVRSSSRNHVAGVSPSSSSVTPRLARLNSGYYTQWRENTQASPRLSTARYTSDAAFEHSSASGSLVSAHPLTWTVSVVRSRVQVQTTATAEVVGLSPDTASVLVSVGPIRTGRLGQPFSSPTSGESVSCADETVPRVSRRQEKPQLAPARGSRTSPQPRSVPREPPARRSDPDPSRRSRRRSESSKAGGR